jgi:transcriptional regulator with XRE-family HTH domain
MNMHTSLGAYIASRRAELAKSQAQVAVESNLSPSHYSQIERGKIGLPGPEIRRKLAAALRTTHLDLLIHAGELLPDELPGGDVAVSPFPAGTVAADIVDLMRDMGDDELKMVLFNAKTVRDLVQKSRQGPRGASEGHGRRTAVS